MKINSNLGDTTRRNVPIFKDKQGISGSEFRVFKQIPNKHYEQINLKNYVQKREKECDKERDNFKNSINTSIESNQDARVSFKGTPLLHHAVAFADKNPLVAEAIFALAITCLLRPLSIMATATDAEDKSKCEYQAAKSISSGVVGFLTTALIATPIAAATALADKEIKVGNKIEKESSFKFPTEGSVYEKSKKIIDDGIKSLKEISQDLKNKNSNIELSTQIDNLIKDNKINLSVLTKTGKNAVETFKTKIKEVAPDAYKIVSDALIEQKRVNNYRTTAKNVADKFFQPVFMPIRAMITIAAIPILLKSLGITKPANNKQNTQQNVFNVLNNDIFKSEKSQILFQPFLGANK